MTTAFPYDWDVSLKLNLERAGEMTLWVRVPGWAAGQTEIRLNGEKIAEGTPGSYVPIRRAFSDGDRITFTLPAELRAVFYNGVSQIEGKSRYAFLYGPVLMALCGPSDPKCEQPGGEKVASLPVTPEEMIRDLQHQEGKNSLTFTVKAEKSYTLKPYIEVSGAQNFTCFPALLAREAEPAVTPEPTPDPTPEETVGPTEAPRAADPDATVKILCVAVAAIAVIAAVTAVLVMRKKK